MTTDVNSRLAMRLLAMMLLVTGVIAIMGCGNPTAPTSRAARDVAGCMGTDSGLVCLPIEVFPPATLPPTSIYFPLPIPVPPGSGPIIPPHDSV